MNLSIGFSPCPNDTFVFHALINGLVGPPDIHFSPRLEDVETLNRLALSGTLDVTKVSYGAVPFLLDEYVILRSGGALGRGCGPLLVAAPNTTLADLRSGRIAIPGRMTTANLLLRLYDPTLPPGDERVYSDIMPAVEHGEADAGLIIHESRFTYPEHGLKCLVDLGEWWERETGAPIPLGAIVARKELGEQTLAAIDTAIRRSVELAFANPDASSTYVREHAQELSVEVTRQHIALYVNEFSLDLGDSGERAVDTLLARATEAGLIPELAGTGVRSTGLSTEDSGDRANI